MSSPAAQSSGSSHTIRRRLFAFMLFLAAILPPIAGNYYQRKHTESLTDGFGNRVKESVDWFSITANIFFSFLRNTQNYDYGMVDPESFVGRLKKGQIGRREFGPMINVAFALAAIVSVMFNYEVVFKKSRWKIVLTCFSACFTSFSTNMGSTILRSNGESDNRACFEKLKMARIAYGRDQSFREALNEELGTLASAGEQRPYDEVHAILGKFDKHFSAKKVERQPYKIYVALTIAAYLSAFVQYFPGGMRAGNCLSHGLAATECAANPPGGVAIFDVNSQPDLWRWWFGGLLFGLPSALINGWIMQNTAKEWLGITKRKQIQLPPRHCCGGDLWKWFSGLFTVLAMFFGAGLVRDNAPEGKDSWVTYLSMCLYVLGSFSLTYISFNRGGDGFLECVEEMTRDDPILRAIGAARRKPGLLNTGYRPLSGVDHTSAGARSSFWCCWGRLGPSTEMTPPPNRSGHTAADPLVAAGRRPDGRYGAI